MAEELRAQDEEEVLLFEASGDRLALLATEVTEIIRPPAMTRVPHSPPHLLGVANLRGKVIPILSLGGMLGGNAVASSPSTRVIVINGQRPLGILVDRVMTLARASDAKRIDLETLVSDNFRKQSRSAQRARTEVIQETVAPKEEVAEKLVFLAFEIGGQEYALPLHEVVGIAAVPGTIAGLPRSEAAMVGVAEVGGSLIPIVSARVLLGLADEESLAEAGRIVIMRLGRGQVGVVVDGMKEIIRVAPDALDPVPPVLTRARGEAQVEAICRLDDGRRLISILAPGKLFDPETVALVLAQADLGAHQMAGTEIAAHALEQFIVFQLGDESYGLPIGSVDEIVRCPDDLTRVPRAPTFVKGLMNLRGKAVPVIDQRQRFSVAGSDTGSRRRIVVVTINGLQAGFLVDGVAEVLSVSAGELSPAPDLSIDVAQTIDRVAMIEREGRMILLVDPKALLDRAERDVLAALSSEQEAAQSS